MASQASSEHFVTARITLLALKAGILLALLLALKTGILLGGWGAQIRTGEQNSYVPRDILFRISSIQVAHVITSFLNCMCTRSRAGHL